LFAPLKGIRVVDFTHVIAGPYTTHILCQLGADVVKIERPGAGDVMRASRPGKGPPGFNPQFVGFNHGKRSIAIDLKSEAGREVVRRLVREGDVLVENLRPGELDKIGLGAREMTALNPRLIYCSISGWGASGELAGRAGYDQVIQASIGMMMTQGDAGDPPMKVGFPLIDVATGMNAACALLAALHEQAATGRGRFIDVAMGDSGLMLNIGALANWMVGRQANERMGNRALTQSPTAGVFETAEGWISLAANTPDQGAKALEVMGRPELVADPRFKLAGPRGGFFVVSDPDGAKAEVVAALKSQSAEHWEAAFNAAGIACAKIRTVDEFVDGPYRRTAGLHRTIAAQPGYDGAVQAPGAGFRVDGETVGNDRPVGALGADGRSVLAELGYGEAEVAALAQSRAVAL